MGACSSQFPFRKKEQSDGDDDEDGNNWKNKNCSYEKDKNTGLQSGVNGTVDKYSFGGSRENSFVDNKAGSLQSFASANFDSEKLLSVYDLYNVLNDSGIRPYIHDPSNFLIIDARDSDSYSVSHVLTAKQHIEFMNNSKNRESLTKYVVIVVYGDEIKNDKPSQELLKLRQRIEEYVASDILILRDGYELFHKKFPYLCTDQYVESIADRKLILCYPSIIVDELLYQGRGDQATNSKIITTLGITHIVNISEHKNAFPNKVKYLKLPLEDMVTTNLSQHFESTSDFINDAMSCNGRILVHCNLGVSRSSTITIAYLMKYRQWKLDCAYRFLKARRTCASPNSGFLRQLSEREAELFGEKYTKIDTLLSGYKSSHNFRR